MSDDPQQPAGEEPAESPEEIARELEEDPARNPEDEELKDIKGG